MSSPAAIEEAQQQKGECGSILSERLATSGMSLDPQESLCHTFYRMIGLPVVGEDGNFYNPGFDPHKNVDIGKKEISISQNVNQTLKDMTRLRENQARERLSIFQKGGKDPVLYGLVMGKYPITFVHMKPNQEFDVLDKQTFKIPARKAFLENNYTPVEEDQTFTKFFDSGTHMLKPFVCDAIISSTVMPGSRLIAAPFLSSKDDTYWDNDIFLDRPIIEQVLQKRLADRASIQNKKRKIEAIQPGTATGGLSSAALQRLALALLDEKNIEDKEFLTSLSQTGKELVIVDNYVKVMKGVIAKFVQAVNNISVVTKEIEWIPLPTTLGPRLGVAELRKNIRTQFNVSELTRKKIELELRGQIANNENSNDFENLGSFSVPDGDGLLKFFSIDLDELKDQELNWVRIGSNALRTIEIITGEISGLGLIDILAIWAALQSLDIGTLISLLDDASFARLYRFFPTLRTPEVVARKNGEPADKINKAIEKLQDRVFNILSFCEGVLKEELRSPTLQSGRSI